MIVLCDTCAVLMLIRIAPDMFTDAKYDCVTIQAVRSEIFGNKKFKDKYPWRTDFKKEVKAISISKLDENVASVVNQTAEENLNESNGRPYGLSRQDKEVAAYAVTNSWDVATGDTGLVEFLDQQFNVRSYSALEILNIWLDLKVVKWSDDLDKILREWSSQKEKPQPEAAKTHFRRLTGKRYPGP